MTIDVDITLRKSYADSLTFDAIIGELLGYRKNNPAAVIAIDAGGMGASFVEEVNRRYQLGAVVMPKREGERDAEPAPACEHEWVLDTERFVAVCARCRKERNADPTRGL